LSSLAREGLDMAFFKMPCSAQTITMWRHV
jgi:hypothetical protein